MPQYTTKQIQEKADVLQLTKDEYDSFNNIYKQAIRDKISKKMEGDELKLAMEAIGDLRYAILTDGYHRVEFTVDFNT